MQPNGVGNPGACSFECPHPVTMSVAEGSFRIMKGLLTPDRSFMSHDSQLGYLLAMINGDVNKRVPSWALWTIFVGNNLSSFTFVLHCLHVSLPKGAHKFPRPNTPPLAP